MRSLPEDHVLFTARNSSRSPWWFWKIAKSTSCTRIFDNFPTGTHGVVVRWWSFFWEGIGMTRHRLAGITCAVLAVLCLWPAAARAQSVFIGVVKDSSGAVLPGVTVEASSPAL